MKIVVRSFVVGSLLLLLQACSSGSSSSGSSFNPTLIAYVVDPAIIGATVELRSIEGDALAEVGVTDDEGKVTFNYGKADLSNARLIARGGIDSETGISFANVILRAPVVATSAPAIVSPLTELVVGLMSEGEDLSAAKSKVASWLGLNDADSDVLANPLNNPAVQLATLKISMVLHALRKEGEPSKKVFEALSDSVDGLIGAIDALKDSDSVSDTTKAYLDEANVVVNFLNDSANAGKTANELVAALNLFNLEKGLAAYFFENTEFNNLTEVQKKDLTTLATAIRKVSSQGVTADGPEITNLIRYLVSTYETEFADFGNGSFAAPVFNQARIKEILSVRGAVSHQLPLAIHQLLGNDNAKRLAYYYSSDLSPFYRAEQYVNGIFDDQILDAVYLNIAEGQAKAGLLDEARITINTRIFQASERVNAQREIGRSLASNGRLEDGEIMLRGALADALRIIDAKGAIDNKEAQMLVNVMFSASYGGLPQVAMDAIEPLKQFAVDNANTTDTTVQTLYGRILSALGNATGAGPVPDMVAECLAGNVSCADAKNLVEVYKSLVLGNPGNANTTAMYLGWTVEYMSLLEYPLAEINSVLDAFYALDNPATKGLVTKFGISYVANHYARQNKADDYIDVIESFATAANASSQKKSAMKALLPWLIEIGVDADPNAKIEDVIDQALVKTQRGFSFTASEKVDALLWLGVNRGNLGAAHKLIEKGNAPLAKEIVDYTKNLMAESEWQTWATGTPAQIPARWVSQGCAKIALAYFDVGEIAQANEEGDSCLQAINTRSWDTEANKAAAYTNLIEKGLLLMGESETVNAMVIAAANKLDDGNLLKYSAHVGNDASALRALTDLRNALDVSLPIPNSDDHDTRLPKITKVLAYINHPLTAIESLRARIAVDGVPTDERLEAIEIARKQIAALLVPSFTDAITKLTASTERKSQLNSLVNKLASAGLYEQAYEVAQNQTTNADRNSSIKDLANTLVTASAFPGSIYASVDTDGDGKPDFFNPVSAELEAANPFTLDEDIDGDGCMDTTDKRPFLFSDNYSDC